MYAAEWVQYLQDEPVAIRLADTCATVTSQAAVGLIKRKYGLIAQATQPTVAAAPSAVQLILPEDKQKEFVAVSGAAASV